ncbi:MAG: tRNA (cytidine(34)-2'-O)-methyltransferase [Planctomycetota bacterium]|nr:tRNA (cytidine(34)-2'-O)-methyltransferase [Planctomycetota bacterium]
MLHVALWEPEIPPNTGNVARLCAASRTVLWIVGQPGFRMDDKAVKRAGLDYWPYVTIKTLQNLDQLEQLFPNGKLKPFSVRGTHIYSQVQFQDGDCLLYGPESRGLPPTFLARHVENSLRIPMVCPEVRSINLSTTVGIGLYEALRQLNFPE